MWRAIAAVGIGGGLGALLRWWLGLALNPHLPAIPPGTLAANLIGGYVVGAAAAHLGGSLLMTFAGIGTVVWLEEANNLGIRGGSAFRAMAGFGRHHVLHESTFFELAGTLAVEVEFIVSDEEAHKLLERVAAAGIRLFYACTPALFGVINPDSQDPPPAD